MVELPEERGFEVAVCGFRRIVAEFGGGEADPAPGQQRAAVVQHQFEHFGEIQPAVGGVAVLLAHDQRLLTARDRPVRDVRVGDPLGLQHPEHHIVVEQRRRGVSRRKVEASHVAEQTFRRIAVNFHRQRRLRLVGAEERLKNHIGHPAAEVVPRQIAAAEQQILRNRPAARADHIERQQMPGQRHRALETGSGQIGFKDPVEVARRERIGIRRLLKAHQLPQQQIGLHRLMQIPGFPHRHLPAVRGDQLQPLRLARHCRALLRQRFGKFGVAPGQNRRRARRLAHHRDERGVRRSRRDERLQPLRQNGAHIRDHVTGDRLHEECDLVGQRRGLFIDRGQPLHIRSFAVVVPDRFDPLRRNRFGRFNIGVNRDRIAVSGEGLHLKTRVDQRVARRKRIVLRAREHASRRNRQRHSLHAAAQQFTRVARLVRVAPRRAHLALAHPDFLILEPAGQLLLPKFGRKQLLQPRIEKFRRIFHLFFLVGGLQSSYGIIS